MRAGDRILQALAVLLFGRQQQQPAAAPATVKDPLTAAPAMPAAEPAQPASPWHALPGNVIELGASGFQIQLDASLTKPLYTLRAPEGWIHAMGADLRALKQMGERFAAERREFECKPMEMKW